MGPAVQVNDEDGNINDQDDKASQNSMVQCNKTGIIIKSCLVKQNKTLANFEILKSQAVEDN